MNVVLLNDTYSWYHWGCTATSKGIWRKLEEFGCRIDSVSIKDIYSMDILPQDVSDFDDKFFFDKVKKSKHNSPIFEKIAQADIVVINGEGTMHRLTKPVLVLLYLAYASKKYFNNKVHIINHSAYPKSPIANKLYSAIYNKCDFIAIREHISQKAMLKIGVKSQLSFDCLPLGISDFSPSMPSVDTGQSIVITNSVSFSQKNIPGLVAVMAKLKKDGFHLKILTGAKAWPSYDTTLFLSWIKQYRSELDWELVDAQSLDEWLDCISSARLLISGRFHHSIAAYFLNTPFVLLDSNTPKNHALSEVFGCSEVISFDDDMAKHLFTQVQSVLENGFLNDSDLMENIILQSNNNFKPFMTVY